MPCLAMPPQGSKGKLQGGHLDGGVWSTLHALPGPEEAPRAPGRTRRAVTARFPGSNGEPAARAERVQTATHSASTVGGRADLLGVGTMGSAAAVEGMSYGVGIVGTGRSLTLRYFGASGPTCISRGYGRWGAKNACRMGSLGLPQAGPVAEDLEHRCVCVWGGGPLYN